MPPVPSIPHTHEWLGFTVVLTLLLLITSKPASADDVAALRTVIAEQTEQITAQRADLAKLRRDLAYEQAYTGLLTNRINATQCDLYGTPCLPGETRWPVRITPRSSRSHARQPLHPDFAALARCESTNNPRAVSPSGAYRGLYQFDLRTWRAVGGHGDPIDASRAEQTKRARLLYADRGRKPWPVCGRYL
jgi:hypothetical protein